MRTAYTSRGTKYKAKAGVEIAGTGPQLDILEAASQVYSGTDQDLVVTSGDEGHRGDEVHSRGSLHYDELALDLRIWNLDDPVRVADQLAAKLGRDFDVVYGPSHDTHIHVEYDP